MKNSEGCNLFKIYKDVGNSVHISLTFFSHSMNTFFSFKVLEEENVITDPLNASETNQVAYKYIFILSVEKLMLFTNF